MSHCAPEATLKPKRFEFTLETVITDVFVTQVYSELLGAKSSEYGAFEFLIAASAYLLNTV